MWIVGAVAGVAPGVGPPRVREWPADEGRNGGYAVTGNWWEESARANTLALDTAQDYTIAIGSLIGGELITTVLLVWYYC